MLGSIDPFFVLKLITTMTETKKKKRKGKKNKKIEKNILRTFECPQSKAAIITYRFT